MVKTKLIKTLAGAVLFLGLTGFVKPVEYVKVSEAFGPGFYYIPGTDTVLKIGGYVRSPFGSSVSYDSKICVNYNSGTFSMPYLPWYDPNYIDDAVDSLDDLTNDEFVAVMDWWWGDGPNPYSLGFNAPEVGRAMDYLWDATEGEGWDIWDAVKGRDKYLYDAEENRLWMYNRVAMNWARVGLPLMMMFNPYMLFVAQNQLNSLSDFEFFSVMNFLWGEGPFPMDTSAASDKVKTALMALYWLTPQEMDYLLRFNQDRDKRVRNQVWTAAALTTIALGQWGLTAVNPFTHTSYNPVKVLTAKSLLDNLSDQDFLAVMDWLWGDGPDPRFFVSNNEGVKNAMASIYYMSNAEIRQLIRMTEERDDRVLKKANLSFAPVDFAAVIHAKFDDQAAIVGSGPKFSGGGDNFQKITARYANEETLIPDNELSKTGIDWESITPRVGLTYDLKANGQVNVFQTPTEQPRTTSTTPTQTNWQQTNIRFKVEETVTDADQTQIKPAQDIVVKLGFPIPDLPIEGNSRNDDGAGENPTQGTVDTSGQLEFNSQLPGNASPEAIKYFSPTFAGFQAGISWDDANHWDVGLRDSGSFGSFRLAAGVSYEDYNEMPKQPTEENSSAVGNAFEGMTLKPVRGFGFDVSSLSDGEWNQLGLGDKEAAGETVNPPGTENAQILDTPFQRQVDELGRPVPNLGFEDPKLVLADVLFGGDAYGENDAKVTPKGPVGTRPDSARSEWALGVRWNLGVGYEMDLKANYLDSKLVYTDKDAPKKEFGIIGGYAQRPIQFDDYNVTPLFYPKDQEQEVENQIGKDPDIIKSQNNSYRGKLGNDPYFNSKGTWGQKYPDQWAIQRVGFTAGADSAWKEAGDNLTPVIVAVIDTGLDWNHADLSWDKIWRNQDEIPDNGIDDDNNGYVDDLVGWDFFYGTNLPWDEDGHGTFVAGLIAADSDNGIGISGINPAARIMVLKALDNFGHTRASYLAEAIKYAVDNGAKIINLSVGGREVTDVEKMAVEYAKDHGVLVFAAAGNEGADTSEYGFVPYDEVIAVGSANLSDEHSRFTNWGEGVDIAAPGEDVLSLRARRTDLSLDIEGLKYEMGQNYVGDDKRYYRAAGTSFSTPIAAGVASLIWSKNPDLSAEEVRRMLLQNARDIDAPGRDQFTGYGLVDARAALAADPAFEILADITGVEIVQDGGVFVAVNGTASANQFGKAQLYIGQGEDPSDWKSVGKGIKKAVESGRLDLIPAADLQGSKVWIVRLVVSHKNGKTREERFTLTLG